jgi:folate-binding protein YgfZ
MRNLFSHPLSYGSIHISGADRSTYLQRLVTNDLNLLKPGMVLPAALTAPTGKMIDLFLLIDRGESIEAISLAIKAAETARYLKSRIFFMDKVTIHTEAASQAVVSVWGEGVEEMFPAGETLIPIQIAGQSVEAVRTLPGLSLGALLLMPPEAIPSLTEIGISPASEEAYETARVRAGVPGIPELRGEYTPFELRLDETVSSTKGCFTGQEVLARQVTYDKITRRLCTLKLEAEVLPGTKVYAGNAPVGELTSVSGRTALAVLRRPSYEPGTEIFVRGEDGDIKGMVGE